MPEITVPDKMWKRFVDELNGNDYCPLCDHHPSTGHDQQCPLWTAPPFPGDDA